MENLTIYKKLSVTPQEARKEISAGRLKGMTDINPMWRIKMLTETFGVCGIGWKYVITDKRLEQGCNGQISAFVDVDLFIKVDGKWSDAIQGTGGSSFVTQESKGLYQSDECFKMALTDAISICCKALGMSADIYFAKDRTKYDTPTQQVKEQPQVAAMDADVLFQWQDEVNKCKSIEDLNILYKSNEAAITANKAILKLFSDRKTALK